MALRSALETLGKFQFTVDGRSAGSLPTNKSRALLAYLIANRGHDVARERLIDVFWGDFEPERAREGLRTALSSIRHALRSTGDGAVELLSANKSVVQWSAASTYDADRFEDLAQSSELSDKRASLGIYRGDFLEGNYEEWAVRERERLAAAYESVLSAIVAQTGDVEIARLLLARNPYDEAAYAALIEAEIEANRPAGAATLLLRYRAAMAEVGAEPSAAFEERFAGVQDYSDEAQEQLTVPFVARTHELQLFKHAFYDRVGTDGYVALIVGEPGIGKTALIHRAEEVAREAGRRTLLIRCSEDPRRLSAWRSAYERLTGRKIDEVAATTSDVATAAARDMVEALAKPSVLFVDDAHLLRGDSLATLEKVIEIARGSSHGVVITLRPEGRERIEPMAVAFTHDTMVLGPLAREDIETALALTVDADAAFAGALYERSGGHPLFFVALLQSLVQKQALRKERGRWHAVRQLDERLELPQDLRSSIETRLHAAGDDAAVIACALALEPSSTAEDLAAVLGYPEPRVLDALDRLMEFALLSEAPVPAEFRFVHDMVREVAATVLNPGRRVALHRAFARRFEQSAQPDAAVRLARHLRAAGMAVGAAAAYLKAARIALERYAVRDAAEFCSEGVSVLERIERTPESDAVLSELHRVCARAAAHAGSVAFALEEADRAVQCARASRQNSDMAKGLIVRASLHGAIGDVRVQLSDALEASALAAEIGERGLSARAAVESAAAARSAGELDSALALATEAVSVAEEWKDSGALYAAYDELLTIQICWWHFADAANTIRKAVRVAETFGPAAQARLSCLRAAYEYVLDKESEAESFVRDSLRSIEPLRIQGEGATGKPTQAYPLPLIAFSSYYLLAVLQCARGNWTQALDATSLCRELHSIMTFPRCANALAMLEINALLGRNFPGDAASARTLAAELPENLIPDGVIGWSDCRALVEARLAARLTPQNARAALRTALDALEENAQRMPLDCDRSFVRLSAAAEEGGEPTIRERALARGKYYKGMRMAAASTVETSNSGAAALHNADKPRASSGSMSLPSV